MKLRSIIIESPELVLPSDFDGIVYKWIDSVDLPNFGRSTITRIPGFVSINQWDNHSFKLGFEYKIDIRSIKDDLLPYQTEPYQTEPYQTEQEYYDHSTDIKPGWLANEFSKNGIAEVMVITVPLQMTLVRKARQV